MIAGDERFGFDPNAFVQRLIEETGISHVWEPVSIKVSEDGRTFSYSLVGGAQERDPRCYGQARSPANIVGGMEAVFAQPRGGGVSQRQRTG
jgi:hypothetical protein